MLYALRTVTDCRVTNMCSFPIAYNYFISIVNGGVEWCDYCVIDNERSPGNYTAQD